MSLLWSVGTAGMQTRLVQTSHCSALAAQSAQIMHSKVLAEKEGGGQRGLLVGKTDFCRKCRDREIIFELIGRKKK